MAERGKIVGMCSGLMTRHDTAFMGFYAVEPEYQGIGIGRELWLKCLKRLEPSVNVGLYGVPAMTEKYKKSGFQLEDSIRMLIYESEPNKESDLNKESLKSLEEIATFGASLELEEITSETSELKLRKLIEYDQSVHRYSREKLLKLYLAGKDIPITIAIVRRANNNNRRSANQDQQDDSHQQSAPAPAPVSHQGERKSSCCAKPSQAAIIEDETLSTTVKGSLSISKSSNLGELQPRCSSPIDIPSICTGQASSNAACPSPQNSNSGQDELEILGYGCIRADNNSGGIIGPIYAETSDLCEVILSQLLKRFQLPPGKIYSVMALSSNKQASKILLKLGLREIDQCTRMFTKFIPTATFSKIYYVHSPNFTLV